MPVFIYPDTSFIRNMLELIEEICKSSKNLGKGAVSHNVNYRKVLKQLSKLEREISQYNDYIYVLVHSKIYEEINMYYNRWKKKYNNAFKKIVKYTRHGPVPPPNMVNSRKIANVLKRLELKIKNFVRITILFDGIFNSLTEITRNENMNINIQLLREAMSEFVKDIMSLILRGTFDLNKYPLCSICISQKATNIGNFLGSIIKSNPIIQQICNNPDCITTCLEDYHLLIAVCCLASLYKNYQKLNGGCSQARSSNNIIYLLISSPINGIDRKCFAPLNNQVLQCNVSNIKVHISNLGKTCRISIASYRVIFFEPI